MGKMNPSWSLGDNGDSEILFWNSASSGKLEFIVLSEPQFLQLYTVIPALQGVKTYEAMSLAHSRF